MIVGIEGNCDAEFERLKKEYYEKYWEEGDETMIINVMLFDESMPARIADVQEEGADHYIYKAPERHTMRPLMPPEDVS